jgi:hypothetical protein
MPKIADTVQIAGIPYDGAAVNAYKATRFGGIPAFNAAPPVGGADAGPVASGPSFGGSGAFQITVPTDEDYYCSATVAGVGTAWMFYPAVENADIVHLAGAETFTGVKIGPIRDKGGAVYNVMSVAVGDGVADDTAALQGLVAAGRTLYLPTGKTFLVSQLKFDTVNDVGITGGGSLVGSDDTKAPLFFRVCQRVQISGIRVTHQNHASRQNNGGIQCNNCTDVRIYGNEVANVASIGIVVAACWRVSVVGNVVHDNLADGISIHGGGTLGGVDGGSRFVTVTGNVLYNTGDDSISVNSVLTDIATCSDIAITGNTVFQSPARGIDITGGSRISVVGNQIDSTTSCGIYVAQEALYRGVSDCLVAGNLVSNANTYSPVGGRAGILVKGVDAANPVTDVSVLNNKVTGSGWIGIQAQATVANAVGTVRVRGNAVIGTGVVTAAGANGIEFDQVILGISGENMIEKPMASGVVFDANCTTGIADNDMVYLPNQGSTASQYGVYSQAVSGRVNGYVVPDTSKTALTAMVRSTRAITNAGVPATTWPPFYTSNSGVSAVNRAFYVRGSNDGLVSNILIRVAVASGNIDVGLYGGTDMGSRAAVPTTQQAHTGSTACPAAGDATLALSGGPYPVWDEAFWLAIAADNTTATWACMDSSSVVGSVGLGNGTSYTQDTAFPLPSPAVAGSAIIGRRPMMVTS